MRDARSAGNDAGTGRGERRLAVYTECRTRLQREPGGLSGVNPNVRTGMST